MSTTERLWASGEDHARRAYKAYIEGDAHTFYREAVTAIEHVSKGYLAFFHPALVVGGARNGLDFDSLLWELGFGQWARQPLSRIRSIDCREALRRCAVLAPAVARLGEEVAALIDHRNGLVHFALLGEHDADRDVLVLAQYVNELLEAAVRDEGAFWGEFAEAVHARLSESVDADRKRVAEQVAAARARFAERFPPGSDETLLALRTMIKNRVEDEGLGSDSYLCPACQQLAFVEGAFGTSGYPSIVVEGPDAYEDFSGVDVEWYPDTLTCPACDLRLRGSELELAGLPRVVVLEDVDAEAYYDHGAEDW